MYYVNSEKGRPFSLFISS